MIINLAELQRTYRAQLNSERRVALRRYLLENDEPTAAVFILVSRRLYATGEIDNLGLAHHWIASATIAERAALFTAISTALLEAARQPTHRGDDDELHG
jgi:hypothetical protein